MLGLPKKPIVIDNPLPDFIFKSITVKVFFQLLNFFASLFFFFLILIYLLENLFHLCPYDQTIHGRKIFHTWEKSEQLLSEV